MGHTHAHTFTHTHTQAVSQRLHGLHLAVLRLSTVCRCRCHWLLLSRDGILPTRRRHSIPHHHPRCRCPRCSCPWRRYPWRRHAWLLTGIPAGGWRRSPRDRVHGRGGGGTRCGLSSSRVCAIGSNGTASGCTRGGGRFRGRRSCSGGVGGCLLGSVGSCSRGKGVGLGGRGTLGRCR